MKEEYEAFIISVLIGVTVGAIVGYGSMLYGPFGKFFFDKNIFAISVVNPILVLALSFMLQRRFSSTWRKIEPRVFCVISMLIMYMFGTIIGMVLYNPSFVGMSGMLFVAAIPLFFPFVAYFSLPLVMITFVYSNIFAIAAAYVVTKGIEPLYKRVISAFVLLFLICMTAASPLGIHAMLASV